ncbi:hypothetical protein X798_03576 [Onchocerca flexuosa]|uniref:Large ribosomal subunit protein mL62 n=1 Tax=Onchocerca flexuosa TaxID=387005 RepID=A0A238BXC2_9BILA|nr:hypothetical protein X798_03576 [Onchocerca flexuosa]
MYYLRQYVNKLMILQREQQQRYFSCKNIDSSEFVGCIPVDRIEKRFMRSSGPGGQNVNMVNTKCQIRFNLSDADWLSPEIKKVFRKRFVRLLTKQYDVVISSDKSRIQTENQEDCFEKLRVMLMECNKELLESRSPTNQDKKILDNKTRRAAQRRLYAKRMESQNKKNRDPYEFI